MEKIRLTPRLLAVGEMIPPGAKVADVGTDHAYLPVWLRQEGICETVIASDIAPGPLDSARVAVKTEPYPGRWTHHIVVSRPEELDPELYSWIRASYDFADRK